MGKVQETLLEQLHSSCITAPFPNVFNSVAQSEELTSIKTTLPCPEEGRGYSQGTGNHQCCRLGVAVAARTATKSCTIPAAAFCHSSGHISVVWRQVGLCCVLIPLTGWHGSTLPLCLQLEIPTPARALLRQPWHFSRPINNSSHTEELDF